jgi:hypothetical protein
VVDARKETITADPAFELINSFNKIIVGKGKKVVEFNRSTDNIDDIMKATLGRTGNLRSPAVQVGTELFIGFNDNIYNVLLSR